MADWLEWLDSRREGPGFESRYLQVVDSIHLYTHSVETWPISFALYRLPLPTRTGQRGQLGLHAGGAKNRWVK